MPTYRSVSGSSAEDLFIELFSDTFGAEKAGYLYSQYPFSDIYQNSRFADFLIENGGRKVAIEIDDEASHNPKLVSQNKFYDDLLKQNSMIYLGWDVYRWAVRQMQQQPETVKDELRVFLGQHPNFKEIEDYLPTQRGKSLDGSKLELKEHQKQALAALEEMRCNFETIALLYHATGTGKTVTAVMDAKRFGKRTLFLAHTVELVDQATKTFRELWPRATVGRYVESMKQGNAFVVCGSIQSVALNLERFKPDDFGYIIVDEAHHASADTYQKVLSYFTPEFTLGLTATPERADDQNILDIFKNTAHKLDIQTAVEIGELVPVRCIRIHTNIDLTKVRFNSVQYNIRDLESKIYVPERNQLIVDTWLQYVKDKRTVIFGLSSAHVAATLAAVMVGYNVIVGQTPDGEPIRLLGESVLNGTILMILATCTISTFATQRGAHNIAIKGVRENDESTEHQDEHILIPVSNEESVRELVTLGNVLKSKKNHNGFYALHAIDNKVEDSGLEKRARKILETAATAAAASDIYLHELLRYDVNISNAIASVAKEQSITDIVMGLHRDKSPAIFLGKITGDLLGESNVTTYIYKPVQPLATIKRHIVIIPSQAEKEAGFLMWLHKIGNLARNTGTKIVVYAPETTLKYIEPLRRKQTATVETVLFKDWEKLPALLRELRTDDCLWLAMSRRERISYQPTMNKIPAYLDQYLGRNSFVLIYPVQAGDPESRYL